MKVKMKIQKGDLVEIRHGIYNHVDAPTYKALGIVTGTEKDSWVIAGHIEVKNSIIPITDVIRIVKKRAIQSKWFGYLQGSLYLTEPPGHMHHNPKVVAAAIKRRN